MAQQRWNAILDRLYGLAGVRPHEETSDRHLLERFAEERDEAAFAELMRRHGPMVLQTLQRQIS